MPRPAPALTSFLALTLPLLLLAAPAAGADGGTPDPKFLERARVILQRAPLIDTHNDLPYALFLKAGGDLTKVDLGKRQPDLPADIPGCARDGWAAAEMQKSTPPAIVEGPRLP